MLWHVWSLLWPSRGVIGTLLAATGDPEITALVGLQVRQLLQFDEAEIPA
jgi:hypothetical protein